MLELVVDVALVVEVVDPLASGSVELVVDVDEVDDVEEVEEVGTGLVVVVEDDVVVGSPWASAGPEAVSSSADAARAAPATKRE